MFQVTSLRELKSPVSQSNVEANVSWYGSSTVSNLNAGSLLPFFGAFKVG